jgi:hypothetical protein
MIIADYLKIDQKAKPIYDCNTAFVIAFILTKIDFQLLWRYFFLGKSKYISYCLMDWNRIFIQKEKPLYHRINTSIFHNVSARVFLFYDPTIGLDSI